MKIVLLVLSLSLAVKAAPLDEGHVHGENGWFVPQIDGTTKWLDRKDAENQVKSFEERFLLTNVVKFYLYTKANPTTPQEIKASKESIQASSFNPNNPVKFTIHGWNSNYLDGVNSGVRRAWFTHGDYNMIAVDWSRGRSLEYASSVAAVAGAGEKIATLIDFLKETFAIPLENFQVIGHSLGAHVAGFTGKQVKGGKIHSIIGLDPAMPLFIYERPDKRLSSSDALYVESIQTNGGVLGFKKPIGLASFYPNGGKTQPGCGLDLGGGCAHGRSVSYYVEAIERNSFLTIQCNNYEEAIKKNCGSLYSPVRLGSPENVNTARGEFYVPVNSKSPFGMA